MPARERRRPSLLYVNYYTPADDLHCNKPRFACIARTQTHERPGRTTGTHRLHACSRRIVNMACNPFVTHACTRYTQKRNKEREGKKAPTLVPTRAGSLFKATGRPPAPHRSNGLVAERVCLCVRVTVFNGALSRCFPPERPHSSFSRVDIREWFSKRVQVLHTRP